MNQQQLAQKRFRKAQKRKNKKYAGPKYSRLEQMFMWAPFLERGGIQLFEEVDKVEQGVPLPDRGKYAVVKKDGTESTTSFTT